MQRKMIPKVLPLLGAVLVFVASVVLAQTPKATVDTPNSPEATETDAPSEPEVPAAAAQPFEDYEASEQISEDLSVAFPVDI